ncbi:uncharacterized protein [Nicotiana tomentosiformis]|uniref:uncharacterized protein n=1 Tax=Nicotiana tomentosiformis TaxID=4098 RepID=UPI00388CA41F
MKTTPCLTHSQQVALYANVTDEEVYEGLCSIGDDKVPGIDGFNDVVYKKSWNIVKQEVCEAVKDFFITGRLHVLAVRLQKVMNCIISEAQAGFSPRRRIADNIILAHELVKSYNRKHISPVYDKG